jgi:hypothetical protein
MIDDRARLLAAFVFTDVVGAWLWVSFRSRRPAPDEGEPRRPRIGLHDDPAAVLGARSAVNGGEREPRP